MRLLSYFILLFPRRQCPVPDKPSDPRSAAEVLFLLVCWVERYAVGEDHRVFYAHASLRRFQ